MDAHITTSEQSGWLVLVVEGDLDLAAAPAVRDRLRRVAAGGRHRLAIHLDHAGVIDSVGLGLLIGARRRAVESGGDVVLVCETERVGDLLARTGLDRLFTIVTARAELSP